MPNHVPVAVTDPQGLQSFPFGYGQINLADQPSAAFG
jgi:hypothetical protein